MNDPTHFAARFETMDATPTLRRMQVIAGRYMEHQLEMEPAFLAMLDELDRAGFGAIVGLVDLTDAANEKAPATR